MEVKKRVVGGESNNSLNYSIHSLLEEYILECLSSHIQESGRCLIIMLSKATLSAYENDKIDFKVSRLVELSKALFTTSDYLLGFEVGEKDDTENMPETMATLLGSVRNPYADTC